MGHKTNIDEIDAIILKNLLNESRTSFTKIAKECNISVAAVRMRYGHLWKEGIINGEVMQVDPHKLGYNLQCLIGIITSKENENKAVEFLKSKPYIRWVNGNFGKYNLHSSLLLHNVEELSKIQRDLEASPLIKTVEALIHVDDTIIIHPENLIIKPFSGRIEQNPIEIRKEEIKIDETDRKIMKILALKSRTSFRKIAEQLGISTQKVIERYKKLRGTVLTLSTINVNLNKLGYAAGAYLLIKLTNKSKITEVETELLKIPNLIVLVKYIGSYDLFAHVVFEDFQEYFKMADGINRIQNIERLDIFLVPSQSEWPSSLFASIL